jgi:hypothetical protein
MSRVLFREGGAIRFVTYYVTNRGASRAAAMRLSRSSGGFPCSTKAEEVTEGGVGGRTTLRERGDLRVEWKTAATALTAVGLCFGFATRATQATGR